MVRELFVMAREHAPSIIFMDEIDSIGSSRLEGGSGGDSEVQRTMLELLNQLDGFEATKNIKVHEEEDHHRLQRCQVFQTIVIPETIIFFLSLSYAGHHGHQPHRHPRLGSAPARPHRPQD